MVCPSILSLGMSWWDWSVRVIMRAVDSGVILLGTEQGWEGAAGVFNKTLERTRLFPPGEGTVNTSHSGRKTCIVVGSALGASIEVLQEWMLVLDQTTVDTYAKQEANVLPGPVVCDLVGFLMDKV